MKTRFLIAAVCVPFWLSAADGFLKALSNNVVWTDSAQWTNGAPASGENAKVTIFATNFAFTVNLAEQDSPWLLGKFDNKNSYNSQVTFKSGEFLLHGSPAELKSDADAFQRVHGRRSPGPGKILARTASHGAAANAAAGLSATGKWPTDLGLRAKPSRFNSIAAATLV